MDRSCSTHGKEEECIECAVEKTEGNRPPGRTRRRWEGNIKINVKNIVS
jgi:hypothetical protein